MASPQVKTARIHQKDTASYNGWTEYYTERETGVEKAGRTKGEQRQSSTVKRAGQPKIQRRRLRGSEFFPKEFWNYVAKAGKNECWLWQSTTLKRNGYGSFWHPELKITTGAHRIAWMLTHGYDSIPANMRVLHKCDVPLCCNPKHLWLGTQLDNMRDMEKKGRRSPDAHTPKGHKWSPEHRAAMAEARQRSAWWQRRASGVRPQASAGAQGLD